MKLVIKTDSSTGVVFTDPKHFGAVVEALTSAARVSKGWNDKAWKVDNEEHGIEILMLEDGKVCENSPALQQTRKEADDYRSKLWAEESKSKKLEKEKTELEEELQAIKDRISALNPSEEEVED